MNEARQALMREYNKALSSRAWQDLRNSQYIEPSLIDEHGLRIGRPQLSLWTSPSGFCDDEPHTLTVFQPFKKAPPLLRKAEWKLSIDLQPLHKLESGELNSLPDPKPTINVVDTTIDGADFEGLLAQAFDLQLPIAWPWPKDRASVTTDVGTVGFEFYDIAEPQASIRCAWSIDLPPNWQPVTDWFGRMYNWLEEQLNET